MASVHEVKVWKWHLYTRSRSTNSICTCGQGMQMSSVHQVKVWKWHLYTRSRSDNGICSLGLDMQMASVHVVKVCKCYRYTRSRSENGICTCSQGLQMASIHEVKVYKWHLTKNMEMGWDTFLNKKRGDIYRLGIEVKLQFWNFCRSRLMKTLGFMVKHLSSSSDASQKQKLSPSAAGFGNYH